MSAERELSTGTTHRYRLPIQAGDYVRVAIDQQAIDVGARLLAPDGTPVIDVSYRQAGRRFLSAIAATSGNYQLEILCLVTSATTGGYVAMIDQQRPAALKDSQRVLAERVFAEADALRSKGQLVATTAALEQYRRAFDLWTTAEDRQGQALAKRRLGEALHALGRFDEALAALLDSLNISRHAADSEGESNALAAAASVCLYLGRMEEAARFSQQALDLGRKTQDRRGEAAGPERPWQHRYAQWTSSRVAGQLPGCAGHLKDTAGPTRPGAGVTQSWLRLRRPGPGFRLVSIL